MVITTRAGGLELIASGAIKVKQCFEGVERVTAKSVILKDGREIEGDAIVLATGYAPLKHVLRKIVGDEVAEKSTVGVGWTDQGELAGVSTLCSSFFDPLCR